MINGIVLLNKERGISSNTAVNKVKHLLKAQKAGHLGTLDVLAEGLLPITIGKGTKLFDYYLSKDKVYIANFKFGQTTDTLDLEGEIKEEENVSISREMVENILPTFFGKQQQLPPIYSAKKINGKTAYSLAREGKDIALSPKEINIYSIKCLDETEKNAFRFEIHCSSGTYIRAICRDLAKALGTVGVMTFLQRTKCGEFCLDDAFSLEQIKNGDYKLINLDSLFEHLDSIILNDTDTDKILNGIKIPYQKDGEFKIYSKGQFLGVGEVINNVLRLKLRLI